MTIPRVNCDFCLEYIVFDGLFVIGKRKKQDFYSFRGLMNIWKQTVKFRTVVSEVASFVGNPVIKDMHKHIYICINRYTSEIVKIQQIHLAFTFLIINPSWARKRPQRVGIGLKCMFIAQFIKASLKKKKNQTDNFNSLGPREG